MRNLVASALRHDGYRLLLASSAEEALAMADAHDGPIDLLLTDAIMPGKSGLELADLMVARQPGPAGDRDVRLHGREPGGLGPDRADRRCCRSRSRRATSAAGSAKCSTG